MNREILFRGKRIDNGEWVYGSMISFDDGRKAILQSKARVFMQQRTTTICCNECYDVDIDTIGQYTGLCDRNGTKIFEGDIIKYCPIYDDVEETGYIKWSKNKAAYIVEVTDGAVDDFWVHTAKKCEVIGNIHDNSDCWKEKKMTEIKLKPCPFCGEKEDIDYGFCTGVLRGFDYVQCESCGAEVHAGHTGAYIAAEERWNKRVDDAEPVKHGKWNITEKPATKIFPYKCEISCSVCGYGAFATDKQSVDDWLEDMNYCSNCGAKMDEKGGD